MPPGAGVPQVVEAQRAGAAQVVPLPLSADDFLHALDGVALLFPPAQRDAALKRWEKWKAAQAKKK